MTTTKMQRSVLALQNDTVVSTAPVDGVSRREFDDLLQRVAALERQLAPQAHALTPLLLAIAMATRGRTFRCSELFDHAKLDPALALALVPWNEQRLGVALGKAADLNLAGVSVKRLQVDREGRRWSVTRY